MKINCKSFVKVFINSFLKIFLKKYVTCLARQVKIAAWVLCILQMLRAEYCIPINDHIGTTNRAVPGYRYIGNYRVLVVGFRYQQNWTTLRIKLFCTAKALYKYIRKIVPCIYVMFYLLKLNWNIIIINIQDIVLYMDHKNGDCMHEVCIPHVIPLCRKRNSETNNETDTSIIAKEQ